jgi:predicted nucleic acid-binding protein
MVATLPLVDAIIFIRHVRQDHVDHSPRATAYLLQIRRDELTAKTNELVLSKVPNKARLRKTLDWYVRYNLSFIDAYLAVTSQEQKLPALVSFDQNYDRVPGVPRVEP